MGILIHFGVLLAIFAGMFALGVPYFIIGMVAFAIFVGYDCRD